MPRGVELGTGAVVDATGTRRQVNEDDIIVYAPDLLPAVLPLVDRNIFLLDAVVAHIEVKSTLSPDALEAAVMGAMAMGQLASSYAGKREIRAVFAYRSTAALRSELVRFDEQTTKLGWNEPVPPLSVICVDEKECYMHGSVGNGPEAWWNLTPDAPDDSTLAFISCIASSVTQIRDSRESVQIGKFVLGFSKALPVE